MQVQVYDPNTQGKVGAGGQTINPVSTAPFKPFWVYYTGTTSNATAASRTLIAEDVTLGSAVVFDALTGTGTPLAASGAFPGDRLARRVGFDVTRPQTSLLNQFAGIVTAVPNGSERGGPIQIANCGILNCRITSAGAVAQGDVYTITDGTFILSAISTTFVDPTNATTATTTVLNIMRRAIAQAQQAQTGAVTDTLNTMLVGGMRDIG